MFGLFSIALLAMVTLEGKPDQKIVSVKSTISLPAPKTAGIVLPSLTIIPFSKLKKTNKLEVRKMPLVKIFEEQNLDPGQISGWAKDKETGVPLKGAATPDWIK